MKRRDFLRTAGGAAGAATAASAVASSAAAADGVSAVQDGNTTQPGGNGTDGGNGTAGGNQTDGNGTDGGTALPGAGQTQTIAVGPNGNFVFDPENVEILPGTQVVWEWESDTHNIVPNGQPENANWPGHTPIENTGFTYSYTFTVEGTYDYYCQPHRAQGMVGSITVTEDAGGGGGGGYEPPDPAHMGIPIQKHFVGALAFMGIFVTLVFTFYLLKYGESAHTAAPSKED